MYKKYDHKYVPSRGVLRACCGIVESVNCSPYAEYMELAASCLARDWDEKEREKLIEAIRLNLINQKKYPFDVLQRKYNLPCCQSTFRRERMRYVRILSGLCGFD